MGPEETRVRSLPDALDGARNTIKEPAGGMWGILNKLSRERAMDAMYKIWKTLKRRTL